MLTAIQQLAEAERIQQLLGNEARHSVALRLTGSVAVWYYCQSRTDILECANRVPRDIDFIYSAGGAASVLHAFSAAGYECDMRLAQESQGSRLRAARGSYKVDAFADPVTLRQTLHVGERLRTCSPCVPLTDLLLLKLQLRDLDHRDHIDICALLVASYEASDDCWRLETKRVQNIVGSSWTWWKAVTTSLDELQQSPLAIVLEPTQRYAIKKQILRIRKILDGGKHTLKWQLERAADPFLPDGNEVDDD